MFANVKSKELIILKQTLVVVKLDFIIYSRTVQLILVHHVLIIVKNVVITLVIVLDVKIMEILILILTPVIV